MVPIRMHRRRPDDPNQQRFDEEGRTTPWCAAPSTPNIPLGIIPERQRYLEGRISSNTFSPDDCQLIVSTWENGEMELGDNPPCTLAPDHTSR